MEVNQKLHFPVSAGQHFSVDRLDDSYCSPFQNTNYQHIYRLDSSKTQLLGDQNILGPGPPIITSDQIKGPNGANLFIFHLPNEISNWDLVSIFSCYSNSKLKFKYII